jgi:hypothetical protein
LIRYNLFLFNGIISIHIPSTLLFHQIDRYELKVMLSFHITENGAIYCPQPESYVPCPDSLAPHPDPLAPSHDSDTASSLSTRGSSPMPSDPSDGSEAAVSQTAACGEKKAKDNEAQLTIVFEHTMSVGPDTSES